MLAYQIDDYGSVEGLSLRECPTPEPGNGEVLIRLHAASLNYRDLIVLNNAYPGMQLPVGYIPVGDGAGEVVALGEGVHRISLGDRVSVNLMRHWIDGDHPPAPDPRLGADGMLAEYVAVNESCVVRIAESLTYAEAAALPCAAVTAWAALFTFGGLLPGQTVLIEGSGGVSLFALQFGKMAGARVIATSSTDEKCRRLLELGAAAVVNYRGRDDWDRAVLDATDGAGVDVAIDIGGPGTLARSCGATRDDGRVVMVGQLTAGERASSSFDPMPLLIRRLRMHGVACGSRAMFEAMNRAIDANGMKPIVDRRFGFAEAHDALRYFQGRNHFGKVVLDYG